MDVCNRLFMSRNEMFELAVQTQVLITDGAVQCSWSSHHYLSLGAIDSKSLLKDLDRQMAMLRRQATGYIEPQEMEYDIAPAIVWCSA